MKKLIALAIMFTVIALVVDSGQKDLVELNHAQIVLIAIGVTVAGFCTMCGLLALWGRETK